MLKRFMNWLLYRLQKALGAISGQRKGHRSGAASRINSSEGYQSEGQRQDSSFEAAGYSDSTLPLAGGDSEPSPFVEASQEPQSQSTVNALVNPAIAEPDTHRRVNASSAALPGVDTAVPSFPTDVSDLVPSSSPATNLDIANEQLPEIHDLLPAVEIDNSVDAAPDEAADTVNASSTEVPDDEADIVSAIAQTLLVEPTTVESTAVEPTAVEPTVSNADTPALSHDVAASNIEERPSQAVLFSFDIIESDNLTEAPDASASGQESVLAQEKVETAPTAEDVEIAEPVEASELSVIETSDIETNNIETSEAGELISSDDSLEMPAAEPDEEERTGLFVDADQPPEVLSDVLSSDLSASELNSSAFNQGAASTEDVSIETAREIEPLPYPWSLAVAKQGSTPTADASEKTDKKTNSALLTESVKRQDNELVTPTPDADSVAVSAASPAINTPEVTSKSGVVKLLFTIKPGNFHGYIVPNDGTQDILFHQKYINGDVFDRLERGDQVVVSVKHIEGKAYATNVDLIQA